VTPLAAIGNKPVTTLEGLADWFAKRQGLPSVPAMHPIQQAFIDEQSMQCGTATTE